MLPHVKKPGEWVVGTASVDGNLDSAQPTWLMRARRGRQWIDLASGPLPTRGLAEQLAATLNATDPTEWDRFISRALREVLSGQWG